MSARCVRLATSVKVEYGHHELGNGLIMASVPQTYTISDFIEWHTKQQLVLAPDFQRGSVWTPAAKVFLIDTILNDLPVPQLYFRTKVDPATQTTIREVVDGQQRLRAILEFASGKLRLTSKSPNFKGKTYGELDIESQERFLSYRIPVVQLLNATDSDVLEVFARLNSYSVKVTPAELRHAEFSEPVKWVIYDATRKWSDLWSLYKIVGTRDSVRLKNTSVMAEMFMFLDNGVGDGGEPSITKYYKSRVEKEETYFSDFSARLDEVIQEILDNTAEEFLETTFYDSPNFLILFAAVSFLKGYLKGSRVTADVDHLAGKGVDWAGGERVLAELSQAFDQDEDPLSPYAGFVSSSKSTTHRIASRKVRMTTLVDALAQK